MKNKKNTKLSEQLQHQISKSQKVSRSISLIHKYLTVHVLGWAQTLQYQVMGLACFPGLSNASVSFEWGNSCVSGREI